MNTLDYLKSNLNKLSQAYKYDAESIDKFVKSLDEIPEDAQRGNLTYHVNELVFRVFNDSSYISAARSAIYCAKEWDNGR